MKIIVALSSANAGSSTGQR